MIRRKKQIIATSICLIILLSTTILIPTNSFARLIFNNGYPNYEFDAVHAYTYIYNYTTTPNSAYKYYTDGGDCTNFASQVLYYAGIPKNGTVGYLDYKNWYYTNPNVATQVSRTWTYAPMFRKYFAVDDNGEGAKRAYKYYEFSPQEALNNWQLIWDNSYSGCIYQLINSNGVPYHTMVCSGAMAGTTQTVIETAQHSPNKFGDLRETLNNLRVQEPNSRVTFICIKRMSYM